MDFNLYSIPTLISGSLSLFTGLFVLANNIRSKVNRIWSVLCFVVSLWLFSYSLVYIINQKSEIITFLFKLGYMGVIFIPIFWYHFIICFLNLHKERKFLPIVYIIGFVFIYLLFKTNYFMNGVYEYFWGYYPRVNFFVHPMFLLFYSTLWLYSVFILYKNMKKESSPLNRNRIKYVFWSLLVVLPGLGDFLGNYGIEFYPFGGAILVTACLLIVAYAILRHHLMEIEVIIKKSLVFAGMFTFIFGVVVAMAMLVSQLLGGPNTILSLAISSLIITFTLRPIETWLINSTDKFLFQKKYEYKQILRAFIDEVITVLNLDEVISSTLKLLDQTLHPYTASIFILNKAEDRYQLYNSLGLDDKSVVFDSDSKLVTFLKKSHNPAVIKQINGIVGVNPEIISEMSKLRAVLVLPLMLHNDLIGFISLGKKKSDEDYSKDDLDVLLDLARTESVAVGNAQLLTEAAQAERRAAIGTMAAGIHHEIGNPLNIINTKIQLFLLGTQRGLYKDKPKEEILRECETILNETLAQTNRISEITRKLTNFAKPSKEFKPERVSIPEEIDEALAVIGHELELERIKIERQISSELPKILADRREIQQIFFNLIRNAAQAIEETGIITLSAVSTSDNKVQIKIRDTGKGIPEDKIHRIFEPFFTTKGSNKGTGLGLSIVRQLVWRNKGEITFRSQVGAGTTFILEFPKEA